MKYALFAAIFGAIVLLALRALAVRFEWLDQPDARKAHLSAVPAVGGLAWMFAFGVGMALAGLLAQDPWLMLGLGIICVLGAVDDRYPLPSVLRLLIQALAVIIAFWHSAPLENFGELFWPGQVVHIAYLAWPITVFASVGVINATNMIDGMDGLLGLILLLTLCLLLIFFQSAGQANMTLICGLAIAALIPFLCLNVRTFWLNEAKVFFGDAGSMSTGLLIAWLLINGSQAPLNTFAPVSALFWLAVPLVDTVSLMLRRLQNGNSPFKPDQQHLHHLLQRVGFSVPQALALILFLVILLDCLGLAFHALEVPASAQLLTFLVIAIFYHFWVMHAIKCERWLGRKLMPLLASDPETTSFGGA